MFKHAQAGDKVYSVIHGHGTIKKVRFNAHLPLLVSFSFQVRSYTLAGKLTPTDHNPELYWEEFIIPKRAITCPKRLRSVMKWRWVINKQTAIFVTDKYYTTKEVNQAFSNGVIQKVKATEKRLRLGEHK